MAVPDSHVVKKIFDSRKLFSVLNPAIRTAFLVFVSWLFMAVFFDLLRYLGNPSSENSISRIYVTKVVDFLPLSGYLWELPEKIARLALRFHQLIKIALIPLVFGLFSAVCFDSFRIPKKLWKFVKLQMSDNYTVFLFASVTFFVVVALNGREYLWSLQLVFLFGAFLLMIGIAWLFFSEEGDVKNSKFLSDRALGEDGKSAVEMDELGMKEDAEQFAKLVLNDGSDVPMVFGIDAPWGSGKSSYLALCKEQVWDGKRDVVVFHFNPTLYDLKRQDLLDVFSGELVATLRKNGIHTRSFRVRLRRLARLFRGSSFSFFGFSIPFSGGGETVDALKKRLAGDIRRSGKRIIAIIDDLDRLYLEDVKDMLGIVRNVFNISGVSFVLCYDSETVNSFESERKTVHRYSYGKDVKERGDYSRESHEPDNQSINAYFEKMVQVKKILVLNRERLQHFFSERLAALFEAEFSSYLEDLTEELRYFFTEENYPRYEKYFGDIRKIKRLFNVILERGMFNHKLDSIDQRPRQLVHLILIYLYHPNLYKELFIKESCGTGGIYFSVPYNFIDSSNKLKIAPEFKEFVSRNSTSEAFLFTELFDVENGLLKKEVEKFGSDRQFEKTNPIFNGPYPLSRNLKAYLDLIVENKTLDEWQSYSYHLKSIKLLQGGESVESIFTELYPVLKGEGPRSAFVTTARNSDLLNGEMTHQITNYILDNLQKYSLLSGFSGTYEGIRTDLVYEMLILLDKKGWQDENGESYANTEDNVVQIAQKILEPSGILSRILDRKRGVLGLYDVVAFYSGSQSAETLFSLKTGLAVYEEDGERGAVGIMARRIWADFRERYIETKRSIFADIEELSETALLGEFSAPIRKAFEGKETESLEKWVYLVRMVVADQIIVLFACESQNGIGHYNLSVSGSGHTIFSEMRTYLFEICFTMDNEDENDETNAQRFVNYLLAGFERVRSYSRKSEEWKPSVKSYVNTLGEKELTEYWAKNGKRIKEISRKWDSETRVHTYNYTAIYRDDLEPLFKELDTLLEVPAVVEAEIEKG